jgi:hypothetical protein
MGIEPIALKPNANIRPCEVEIADNSVFVVQSILARRIWYTGRGERSEYETLEDTSRRARSIL